MSEERRIAPISDEELDHIRIKYDVNGTPTGVIARILARLDRAEAVVEAAEAIGDSNFRKLEETLRKGSWGAAADRVQEFRKRIEDWIQSDAWHTGGQQ